MRLCSCRRPTCLGPDPNRPEVRHRLKATVVGIDRGYAAVKTEGRPGILSETRFLLVGRQIPTALADIGQIGWLVYVVDGRSGLDYFEPV